VAWRSRTLQEACRCKQFWGLTSNRSGNSLDKPEDDFVDKYREFRKQCPDKSKQGHEAFCQRCDNSYPSEIGGANFLRKQGVVETNPFEKFTETLAPRKAPTLSPTLWENLGSFIQRVPLAPKDPGAKIKELTEFTALEKDLMADTDATRDLFRELLGMTGGANASGRGKLHIPADIMDSLSGDAAQDELARNHLIMEMDRWESRHHDPRFVSLDLMEMEATDVDGFLKAARKKIMKRSKGTRKACCSKIGGVLDQMMGSAGGEYADKVQADDRGRHDPIGDADDAKTFKMVKESTALEPPRRTGVNPGQKVAIKGLQTRGPREPRQAPPSASQRLKPRGKTTAVLGAAPQGGPAVQYNSVDVDLLSFIAEEFDHWEHNQDCRFSDPNFSLNESALMQTRRPGLLRDHFRLTEGAAIPLDKAKAAYSMLKQKKAAGKLSGKEAALLPRLAQYIKMAGKGGDAKDDKQEENVNMEPSRTASALSSFMESSHTVNRYKAADKGSGKGAPDAGMMAGGEAGDLTLKTRDDNKEYPTELMPAKGGGKKTAGQPQSLSTRGKDRGDPIGEGTLDENLKPEHIAVYKFRKESPESRQARISHYKKTGEVMESEEAPARRVSQTANALSNFMEATGQYAEAKKRLALGSKDAGDLDMNKRPEQRLGGALESAKKVRAKIGKPRWEDDPEGGADDKGAHKN
jgi:hypothetical protein